MVDDLVITAHFWVLIAQCVEAVRTGDHDLALLRRNAFEGVVQNLNVLLCKHLEQELVTRAAGRVTRAAFTFAEHSEFHTSGVEQVGDGAGGLGGVVVVHTSTADPEQVFGVVEVLDVLANDRDLDAVCLGLLNPVRALAVVLAPWVALGFQVLKQTTELRWEVGFCQHPVAAHVHDVVDVLDIDRALFHTCTTVGAAPQHVRIDDTHFAFSNQLQQRHVCVCFGRWVDGEGVSGEHAFAASGTGLFLQQIGCGRHRVIAKIHNQFLRAQRLFGVPGWALLLASTTLRAGGEVHPALPREVVDGSYTDIVRVRVGVFHGQRASLGRHWLSCTKRVDAISVALEEDVEERHEAVPCDTPAHVHTNDEQPHHAG